MKVRHEMASVSSDFERFLKANFPDDYRKVTDPDVKDDVLNAILSRREEDYKVWCRIPEWIKNEYADNLQMMYLMEIGQLSSLLMMKKKKMLQSKKKIID